MSQGTVRSRQDMNGHVQTNQSSNGSTVASNGEPPTKRQRKRKSRWETAEDMMARSNAQPSSSSSNTNSITNITITNNRDLSNVGSGSVVAGTGTGAGSQQVLNLMYNNNNNTMNNTNNSNVNVNTFSVPRSQPINYATTTDVSSNMLNNGGIGIGSGIGSGIGNGIVPIINLNNHIVLPGNGINMNGNTVNNPWKSSPIADTILKQKLDAINKLNEMKTKENTIVLPSNNNNNNALNLNGVVNGQNQINLANEGAVSRQQRVKDFLTLQNIRRGGGSDAGGGGIVNGNNKMRNELLKQEKIIEKRKLELLEAQQRKRRIQMENEREHKKFLKKLNANKAKYEAKMLGKSLNDKSKNKEKTRLDNNNNDNNENNDNNKNTEDNDDNNNNKNKNNVSEAEDDDIDPLDAFMFEMTGKKKKKKKQNNENENTDKPQEQELEERNGTHDDDKHDDKKKEKGKEEEMEDDDLNIVVTQMESSNKNKKGKKKEDNKNKKKSKGLILPSNWKMKLSALQKSSTTNDDTDNNNQDNKDTDMDNNDTKDKEKTKDNNNNDDNEDDNMSVVSSSKDKTKISLKMLERRKKKLAQSKGQIFHNDDTVYDETDILIDDPMAAAINAANVLSENANKKQIAEVDHSKINYVAIRKNLYVESPEIKKLSNNDIEYIRETKLENCKISGKNCPKPIFKWTQCGLSDSILIGLDKLGYKEPFPIQCQAIPAIMSGRDLIGCAKTGSGKTLAFIIPMFRHIMARQQDDDLLLSSSSYNSNSNNSNSNKRSKYNKHAKDKGPIGLIMAPTRELASQITVEIRKFTDKYLQNMIVCPVFGGSDMHNQISLISRGCDIIVCTPGRMIAVLCTNRGRLLSLERVSYVVLDEADRMFDLGFEPQIMSIIKNIRPDKQIVMFSATFPKSIEKAAKSILGKHPISIVIGKVGVVPTDVTQFVYVIDPNKGNANNGNNNGNNSNNKAMSKEDENKRLIQKIMYNQEKVKYEKTEDLKYKLLLQLLGKWIGKGSILIFHDKRENVDELYSKLYESGYKALVLHGGVNQIDRQNTISEFKSGKVSILISTSIAARGLDVKNLNVVISYTCAHHLEDYIHRVGRTGRAGNKGVAYTFITYDEMRYAPDILKAMKKSGQEDNIPQELRDLCQEYADKVATGEMKVLKNDGYKKSCHGFKFDENEENIKNMEKQRQKLIYGTKDEIRETMSKMFEQSAALAAANNAKNNNNNNDNSKDKNENNNNNAIRISTNNDGIPAFFENHKDIAIMRWEDYKRIEKEKDAAMLAIDSSDLNTRNSALHSIYYNSNKSFIVGINDLKNRKSNSPKYQTREECEREIDKITKDLQEMKSQKKSQDSIQIQIETLKNALKEVKKRKNKTLKSGEKNDPNLLKQIANEAIRKKERLQNIEKQKEAEKVVQLMNMQLKSSQMKAPQPPSSSNMTTMMMMNNNNSNNDNSNNSMNNINDNGNVDNNYNNNNNNWNNSDEKLESNWVGIFYINDYPNHARQKICSRNNRERMSTFYKIQCSIKGTFVGVGQRSERFVDKLYIFIKGTKKDVMGALRDIQQTLLEESAKSMMNSSGDDNRYHRFKL